MVVVVRCQFEIRWWEHEWRVQMEVEVEVMVLVDVVEVWDSSKVLVVWDC